MYGYSMLRVSVYRTRNMLSIHPHIPPLHSHDFWEYDIYTHSHAYTHTCTRTHIYTCTRTHICMHVCMFCPLAAHTVRALGSPECHAPHARAHIQYICNPLTARTLRAPGSPECLTHTHTYTGTGTDTDPDTHI